MPKMVLVEWLDAIHLTCGWNSDTYYKQEAKNIESMKHLTCGFLLEDNDSYVVIALDFRDSYKTMKPVCNMAQVIHKNMIVSMTSLTRDQ